jgi:hypothetical protein
VLEYISSYTPPPPPPTKHVRQVVAVFKMSPFPLLFMTELHAKDNTFLFLYDVDLLQGKSWLFIGEFQNRVKTNLHYFVKIITSMKFVFKK